MGSGTTADEEDPIIKLSHHLLTQLQEDSKLPTSTTETELHVKTQLKRFAQAEQKAKHDIKKRFQGSIDHFSKILSRKA